MAKERHRAQSEALPGYENDRIKSQKNMVFVKTIAGECYRELMS